MKTETMKPKKVLKDEQFGNPISARLSLHLKKYTSNGNWADVSRSKGVGTSTIRDVIYRRNSLTPENSKAIIALVEIAMENCEKSITEAAEAKTDLKAMLT